MSKDEASRRLQLQLQRFTTGDVSLEWLVDYLRFIGESVCPEDWENQRGLFEIWLSLETIYSVLLSEAEEAGAQQVELTEEVRRKVTEEVRRKVEEIYGEAVTHIRSDRSV